MNKKERQNTVLNDTYFNKPPCLIRLFLIRLVLLSGLSASAVYAVGDLLLMEYGLTEAAICAGIASAVIFTLASVLPSGIVYFLSLGGYGTLFFNDELMDKLTYFFDYLMIRLDSRLLDTEKFVIHSEAGSIHTEEACILGLSLVGILMGILFSACCRTRFHGFYAFLVFATFAAPSFVAEIAGYHISIAVFAAFFMGFYAIHTGYELDGMFGHVNRSEAGEASRRNEKTYRRRRGFAILGRKLKSDIPRYMKYSSNGIIALVTAGAVAVTMGHIIPQGTTFDYEKFFADVQEMSADLVSRIEEEWGVDFGNSDAHNEYFSYSRYGDNSGGIGISKPSDSAAPVLDVTLGRNDIPVYLKGDIGVNFSGTNWTSVSDEYEDVTYLNQKMWEQVKDFYPEIMYENSRQHIAAAGYYDPDDFLPLQKVSVTYRKRTAVVFQPLAVYAPDYKTSGYFDSFGDYILRTKSGENYLNTIENLALTPDMSFEGMKSVISGAEYSLYRTEYELANSDIIIAYDKYVKGAYLDQRYENIDGLIAELYEKGYITDWMFGYQKAQGICDYFRQNFSYSLSVDNGEGAEVLDSFLYETKQGHCALFATATTLALRELGVPARYVTGYVVAGEGEAVDGGYKYTLREKDLHAWVEVYIDNIGWLPFDPTAAVDGFEGMASEGVRGEEESSVTSEVTTTTAEIVTTVSDEGDEIPELTESADTTTKPPVSADGTGDGEGGLTEEPVKEDNPLIPVLITALCVIAAVALVIVAVRLFIKRLENAEKKVWTGFRRKNPYLACQEMYKLVMLILDREGLSPGCELMNDFAARVDGAIFMKGINVFLADVMPVFIKCEFGTAEIAPVSEEERVSVYRFTVAVYRRYMENKSALGRFITRIKLFL